MAGKSLITSSGGPLRLAAHRGDRSVLLAMDLDEAEADHLAGFAIFAAAPGGKPRALPNRLSFSTRVTSATTAETRTWHPSDEAPFQKFRWVDIPPTVIPGTYDYRVVARRFGADRKLVDGPSATISIDLLDDQMDRLAVGFTRGYISSQACAQRFHNAPIAPDPTTVDFDTSPFEQRYEWLGFHGRELLFGFLDDCVGDAAINVDAFAYDLNEPDVIRRLVALGPRLRLYLDNSALHVDDPTHPTQHRIEPQAQAAIVAAGGQVRTGHFARFAHDKVLIARRGGSPVRVLTGSANFSVRGLYVQANNVLVFEAPPGGRALQPGIRRHLGSCFEVSRRGHLPVLVRPARRGCATRPRGLLAPR